MNNQIAVSFNTLVLRESAVSLAKIHKASKGSSKPRLIKPILEKSREVLTETYRTLSTIVKSEKEISPASEWLLDNFYIIQEQIVQIGIDFPKNYHQNIPLLSKGEHAGFPRVYDIILNLLTHTDNVLDKEVLTEYIKSYQEEEPLQIGEIWAIPIMIRLFLIQMLAEKAATILEQKKLKIAVEKFVEAIQHEDLEEPGVFSQAIAGWFKEQDKKAGLSTLIELFNNLQTKGLLYEEQKRWFNYRINHYEITLEEAMRQEAQKESRLEVNVQNAVLSLRQILEVDWSDFVEDCSLINDILKHDPSGDYQLMDFQTRDNYRKVIEKVSRRSSFSEIQVAQVALNLAQEQETLVSSDGDDYIFGKTCIKRHIGFFLLGEGYKELIQRTDYSVPLRERSISAFEKHFSLYLFLIASFSLVFLSILWLASGTLSHSLGIVIAVILVASFPAFDLAVSVVNRFFAFFLPPRLLPKMNDKTDVKDAARTMVVMPTMLVSVQDALRQIENLEVHFLGNPDPGLQFVLLSDFTDAQEKDTKGDAEILEAATDAIHQLNEKYASRFGERFFMLHRERLWNPSENVWMGWERKRGKLEEFNQLLYNPSSPTSYTVVVGDFWATTAICPVQFVITLDADTKLPPGTAKKLINTIAHPLNRAWYDKEKGRITKGYTIIQPRISFSPESEKNTRFSKIFSGNVGLDPYSAAVSDIYQDLTGEASFTGKGIYDVKAFHEVMMHQFPENRILSHDLIESAYVRTGLATDIELYDDYPSTYSAFTKRNHRWTRGDWQIASWLFSHVPSESGIVKNPINLLSKWKIFDNLRRSLNFFFLLIFFLAGIFWLPGANWIWVVAAFGIIAFPTYITLSSDLLNRPARVRWKLHMVKVWDNLRMHRIQAMSTIIVAPHQAFVQLDAIMRTLYRLTFSKKLLLEWSTASQVEHMRKQSLVDYMRWMILPMLLGVLIVLMALVINPAHLWVVIPFFVLWFGSPFYAWYISLPLPKPQVVLSDNDRSKLRLYARRTWAYFERFVNEKHGWLPPDNYQENPQLSETARTSPTNIGLALVSTTTAYHLGYMTLGTFLQRQEDSMQAIVRLEKYRGHLFNWYATGSGRILQPSYISTVDSGNLAASLITVKEAVKEIMTSPGMYKNFHRGLRDTLSSIHSILLNLHNVQGLKPRAFEKIQVLVHDMLGQLDQEIEEGTSISLEFLEKIKIDAEKLAANDVLSAVTMIDDLMVEHMLFWLNRPLIHINDALAELGVLSQEKQLSFHVDSCDEWRRQLGETLPESGPNVLINHWQEQAEAIILMAEDLIDSMDFSFLYQKERGLFSIGYNLDIAQFDKSTYDLLASEARIASYIAIAKGDVPVEHWFRLSRRLTRIHEDEMLLSWGGTMFEYLMPLLFFKSFEDTMMDSTCRNVIRWQKKYGHSRGFPWGSSESAYYFLNIDLHYQYRTFGVPGLGLKRGLADEYVVAPYASILSLMVEISDPIKNLQEVEAAGGLGMFGFYDAIDYTTSHLTEGTAYKVVKTYMVHHHGMSLIALENVLNEASVRKSFHADPRIKSCELLLQERIPKGTPIKEPHPIDAELEPSTKSADQYVAEHAGINELDLSPPRLHTLSNGSFSTMITHAGTGFANMHGVTLNGWKADATIDPLGFYFYVKDVQSGDFWSAMHQPVKRKPDRYDTWFHNGKVMCSRVDNWIETTSEICVSPDHPIELRKLTFTNYSDRERVLEITSYAEVILNGLTHHHAHPAFSKLFVETEYLEQNHTILAKRRPRSKEESPMYLIHTFACSNQIHVVKPVGFETERSNFIGSGRSLSNPIALTDGYLLQRTQGNVSDPIVSLRKQIILQAGEKAHLSFGLGFATSREVALQIAAIYDSQLAVNRAFDLASIYGLVELNHMGIRTSQAHLFQRLSSYLLFGVPTFRADAHTLLSNRKKQADLWAYGISGDFPLIIFRINEANQLKHIKLLLKAHSFWRKRGIESELLILNEHAPGYIDEIQEAIQIAIESSLEREVFNKRGGIFIYKTDKIQPETLTLLLSVAQVVWNKQLPNLAKVLQQTETQSWLSNHLVSSYTSLREWEPLDERTLEKWIKEVQFFNGYGGFSMDGTAYHILISTDPHTGVPLLPPAPWINVIANPTFGFTVSERGAGYTWSENSRENKLTSWSNDPVMDTHSEAFYIRDEERMHYWSPCPGPVAAGTYQVTHGFGYTAFYVEVNGLKQHLRQFVHVDKALKCSILTLTNTQSTTQKLSVFRYLDRVLGVDSGLSSRFVNQEVAEDGATLFASNNYNNEFAGRTVFSTLINPLEGAITRFTTDKNKFIGRNRSLGNPLALDAMRWLDNDNLPGGDSCAVMQTYFELGPGKNVTLIFLEGEECDRVAAEAIIHEFSELSQVEAALEDVHRFWKDACGKIVISTPDQSLNILVNGWLVYQNLSCRMWARTGFYQSGGAYGFRDQLQDSMAARYVDPLICKNQLLLHAKQQFLEGDVLHWWHPPTGRGIRSKITDDRLWLPYVLDFYLSSTGDTSVLTEIVSYINARSLETNEHEVYLHPHTLEQKGTLYEHCCKAIDISLKFGVNGLPLIGGGDWNDGMNRVGEGGQGESVWLGFFLYDVLIKFEKICRSMEDVARSETYAQIAEELKFKLNTNGWDGAWYLRAFYDDGSTIGSSLNDECTIDAISQAWSIISGVASPERGAESLKALEQQLVSEEKKMIRLLTPPFDKTDKDPGYIKGYIPGVRENGGQYTHGALWAVKAFAAMGMGEKAVRYLHMINPINHSLDKASANVYKVEPYVIAADVYSEDILSGQGGWTWYTGSAGWMYRVALESVLGIQIRGNSLLLNPAISENWEGYTVDMRLDDEETRYHIQLLNPEKLQGGLLSGTVDGEEVRFDAVPAEIFIYQDKKQHHIRLQIIPFPIGIT
ncbi:GH36-type glycosyl hydrolase domain-containing protein [Mongoliitalea daihaiensis]|uniref:GH36-type glycosyl hydrolase domain-containing protein n=1 Tax=Mongoliitalea daihaiensis TaxID=2782006 RepID=UPI001F3E7226|nr:glucoamylase family protein [Mongoliitalea daihaiensis]UJP64716.1 glycosyltransferase 36 [Mongoliitalea daihaiensis]